LIVIIDYGMGNLGSIQNMLKKVNAQAVVSSDRKVIASADKLILPGVGSFDHAIANLNRQGLIPLLNEKTIDSKIPLLGVCLGMQLLTKRSEEGVMPGLGWIDAETVRFRFENQKLKIPHMGWNSAEIKKRDDPLFKDFGDDPRFYFVHSYYVRCNDPSNVLAITNYGLDFCSSVVKENIRGVQFHPEKSHKFGMRLLKNFADLT
jgi:glutamine amidotransferase